MEPFWERPIEELNREQWEALCDGCGKCCLNKVEDEDTGRIYKTNVACRLLDLQTARCSNYRHRRSYVPDCIRLTPRRAIARMASSDQRQPPDGARRRHFGGQ